MHNKTSDENHDDYYDHKEEEYIDLSGTLPLEKDKEEVKEGKGLKVLTPNKALD